MKQASAIQAFDHMARHQARVVFTVPDLKKLLGEAGQALQATLGRLVGAKILARAMRGVYVYQLDTAHRADLIESVAIAARRGHYNYISLESALSAHGAISQVPLDRLTVMTTGRSGEHKTQWGVIEFTHTKRSVSQILDETTWRPGRLRMATAKRAWGDLKRVGRNTHLVDMDEIDHE